MTTELKDREAYKFSDPEGNVYSFWYNKMIRSWMYQILTRPERIKERI